MRRVLLSAAWEDSTRARHVRIRSSRVLADLLSKGRRTKGYVPPGKRVTAVEAAGGEVGEDPEGIETATC